MKIRCYQELKEKNTFLDRYEYLKLDGIIGEVTFGFERYLNQVFYKSKEWKRIRNIVIMRDQGCDLGIEDRGIFVRPLIHHMNPITDKDIINMSSFLLNPEYLITTTLETHNAIHYGDISNSLNEFVERKPNDTSPWRGD